MHTDEILHPKTQLFFNLMTSNNKYFKCFYFYVISQKVGLISQQFLTLNTTLFHRVWVQAICLVHLLINQVMFKASEFNMPKPTKPELLIPEMEVEPIQGTTIVVIHPGSSMLQLLHMEDYCFFAEMELKKPVSFSAM